MSAHAKRPGAEGSANARIVRYNDLLACRDAFIDTRSPGSDRKENFTIIGPGVSENPNQHVHIAERHGFNIGGARQPPGCLNSQHSHETAEVFYVHSGRWRFMSGETARDGETFLGPGDLISLPTRMFRGFENVGDDVGFLWAVLGGDDPGRVLWSPYVFDMAQDFGLILLEDGMLIDRNKGETVPPGKRPMPRTTQAQVDALARAGSEQLSGFVVPSTADRPPGAWSHLAGVAERMIVGAAPVDWPHGFTISGARLAPGAVVPPHRLAVPDVWFVQSGEIEIGMGAEVVLAGPGDTATLPVGMARSLRTVSGAGAQVVLVRGGDALARPDWA
jgi:mannose-6-phosphate isomerase-like protein (cupin superfamily)